jgi:hypothetical protein
MAIQSIRPPRATTSPLAAARRERVFRTARCQDQRIAYEAVPLSVEHYTALGFNARHFRPGAQVILMKQEVFSRFSAACGASSAVGLYPLCPKEKDGKENDLEAVLNGKLPVLPDRSRTIALPEDHSRLALVHEVLHDIFIGGGLPPEQRLEFTRQLSFWYKITLAKNNLPHQYKNRAFFEQVAEDCKQQYDLAEVPAEYYRGRPWRERDFKIFAGECFAYAGESMLLPEKAKFRQVPEPLVSFLKFVRVIDPRAIRAGS